MKKKGFTIVELVVVIAIIGILSAILIPTFAGLTSKAQDAALQSNLHNAYLAYSSEYADSPDFVQERDAIFSTSENLTIGQEAYKFVASNEGQWSWVRQTITTDNDHSLASFGEGKAFNGYYIYALVANPPQP